MQQTLYRFNFVVNKYGNTIDLKVTPAAGSEGTDLVVNFTHVIEAREFILCLQGAGDRGIQLPGRGQLHVHRLDKNPPYRTIDYHELGGERRVTQVLCQDGEQKEKLIADLEKAIAENGWKNMLPIGSRTDD